MAYKTVAAPAQFGVGNKQECANAVRRYGDIITREAVGGWRLIAIREIPLIEQPGCLGRLFGRKESAAFMNMLVFYRGERYVDDVRREARVGGAAHMGEQTLASDALDGSEETIPLFAPLKSAPAGEDDADHDEPTPAATGVFDAVTNKPSAAILVALVGLLTVALVTILVVRFRDEVVRKQPAASEPAFAEAPQAEPYDATSGAYDSAWLDEPVDAEPYQAPSHEQPQAAPDPSEVDANGGQPDSDGERTDSLEQLVLEGATRRYSRSELTDKSEYELSILRNGMFAISGKRFSKNREVIDYFNACSWYEPRYDSDSDARARMNDYQLDNLDLIISVERDKGYR